MFGLIAWLGGSLIQIKVAIASLAGAGRTGDVRFIPKSGDSRRIETSQIHRIHPNMPAATMMGIGLMWDFQKRIVHAAVTT